MPSPIPLPKHLRRVMVSFRVLPAVVQAFHKHVKKTFRSQWLEKAVTEKLERERASKELLPLPSREEDLANHG